MKTLRMAIILLVLALCTVCRADTEQTAGAFWTPTFVGSLNVVKTASTVTDEGFSFSGTTFEADDAGVFDMFVSQDADGKHSSIAGYVTYSDAIYTEELGIAFFYVTVPPTGAPSVKLEVFDYFSHLLLVNTGWQTLTRGGVFIGD